MSACGTSRQLRHSSTSVASLIGRLGSSVFRLSAASLIGRLGSSVFRLSAASLIGRLGSSVFRLSAAAVSMSPTGSCFSSESAPRPFHHGIRRRGGTTFRAALLSDERQVHATERTHLIHRPARDIVPPLGGARVSSYRVRSSTALMLLRPPWSTETRCRRPICGA